MGDYEPEDHGQDARYLSDFKFCPKQVDCQVILSVC